MASIDTVLTLYGAAGALEASGVTMTMIDLRAKAKIADDVEGPAPPSTSQEAIVRDAAAAHGVATYGQAQLATLALVRSLRSRRLIIAALLLIAGIVVGTVANGLSATR
jgi:hypothetical protein